MANRLTIKYFHAEVAERTNAAGSRPVLPSGKLGFKSLPRRHTISTNPITFVPHTIGIYTYKNTIGDKYVGHRYTRLRPANRVRKKSC